MGQFYDDFHRRFSSLLGIMFRGMDTQLALGVLEAQTDRAAAPEQSGAQGNVYDEVRESEALVDLCKLLDFRTIFVDCVGSGLVRDSSLVLPRPPASRNPACLAQQSSQIAMSDSVEMVFDDDDQNAYEFLWFLAAMIRTPRNSYGFCASPER